MASRIKPVPVEAADEACQPGIDFYEKLFGYVPECMMVMAHKPDVFKAFCDLSQAVQGPQCSVSTELRMLVATVCSDVHGCRYCTAHAASMAEKTGATAEKVQALWQFEDSPLFTDAERAALSYAFAAASVPNEVTDAHLDELREHYSDIEILEITCQIAFMGWLNRFNDSLATTLEPEPLAYGEQQLGTVGWEVGKAAAR